jgi:hypothetical protein
MTSSEATALQARIAGIGGCAFLLGEAANARQLWEVPVLDAHCCREYFLGATLNESISLLHASILVWGPKPLPWRKTIGIILTVVFTKQMTITRHPGVSAVPDNSSEVQPEPRLVAIPWTGLESHEKPPSASRTMVDCRERSARR